MITDDWFAERLASLGVEPGVALVGVSGGADSLALLHLLRRAAPVRGLSLIVAHADHGIHPRSASVADRVVALARDAAIPVEVGHLQLGEAASEGVARRERYRWFHEVIRRTGARYLFLAHHCEDQAETILMRVLAGSGPSGLAGMAPVRGRVVRPLLDISRTHLRARLAETGWEPWEDPANLDLRHTRGWLRQQVLPMLQARDPKVISRLTRLGTQAASDRRAWVAVLAHLPGLDPKVERGVVSVAAAPLRGYDSDLARAVLRTLVRRAGGTASQQALRRLAGLVQRGTSGSWVPLGGGWRGEFAFGRVRIVSEPSTWATVAVALGGSPGAARLGHWTLRWRSGVVIDPPRRDGWSTWVIPGVYTLRPWRPGDRVHPLGGLGSRLVVRCMQDDRVARSERAAWPVMVAESGEVVWVPGVCRGAGRAPSQGEEGVRVDVEQS